MVLLLSEINCLLQLFLLPWGLDCPDSMCYRCVPVYHWRMFFHYWKTRLLFLSHTVILQIPSENCFFFFFSLALDSLGDFSRCSCSQTKDGSGPCRQQLHALFSCSFRYVNALWQAWKIHFCTSKSRYLSGFSQYSHVFNMCSCSWHKLLILMCFSFNILFSRGEFLK